MKLTLNTFILYGALLGVTAGLFLGHAHLPGQTSTFWLACFDFWGRLFIGVLKIVVIPLVFSSIAAGIANLKNSKHAGRVWPSLMLYSLMTTSLAATTGLTAMNVLKPGVGLDTHLFKANPAALPIHSFTLGDFGHKIFESIFMNPLAAIAQNNILAIVVFAIVLGIGIIVLGNLGRPLLYITNGLFEIMMRIVRLVMYLAPLGVMGLLAQLMAQANWPLLSTLAKYITVVVGSTLVHGLITLPLILWLATRTSLQKFWSGMKEALITAFSTSSSSATLPVSLRCVTKNLEVRESTARFVLPIGATLNMDGTAMYEAMAALFVANLYGIHLGLGLQIIVALTAMLASIGAPGIPSAGMVTMIMVLQSVGLPIEAVGLLIAIDRPLDTIRTVVNVEGDCIGACVVDHWIK